MRALTIVLILVLVFGALFSAAISIVGNHAIDVMAEQASNPSAADLIFQSRQTPPVAPDRSNAGWLGAGLLAVVLVSLGAVVFTMKGGADLLRQWRLAMKKPGHMPMTRPLPHAPYSPELQEIPNVPPARRLREVNEYEDPTYYG
jgi:hypothetical protein